MTSFDYNYQNTSISSLKNSHFENEVNWKMFMSKETDPKKKRTRFFVSKNLNLPWYDQGKAKSKSERTCFN